MGIYNLCIKAKFDAAHFLEGYKGACATMHGHTWKVEVLFETDRLDELGMAVDFKLLKRELQTLIMQLDHQVVNSVIMEGVNPTAENIARWFFVGMKKNMLTEKEQPKYPVRLMSVIVWESDDAWASYSE